jgi:hypothetical protein
LNAATVSQKGGIQLLLTKIEASIFSDTMAESPNIAFAPGDVIVKIVEKIPQPPYNILDVVECFTLLTHLL